MPQSCPHRDGLVCRMGPNGQHRHLIRGTCCRMGCSVHTITPNLYSVESLLSGSYPDCETPSNGGLTYYEYASLLYSDLELVVNSGEA